MPTSLSRFRATQGRNCESNTILATCGDFKTLLHTGGDLVEDQTFLANVATPFPTLSEYRYDFTTGQYLGKNDLPIDWRALHRAGASERGRASRAGEATLRRAIFLQSLLAESSRQKSELLENIQSRRDSLEERERGESFCTQGLLHFSSQTGLI
ncbi:MAG: hypothetical protein U1A53_14560 [Prosthecobacter sp.]|nr:hypothetical protein [Prosthecobacter sp.]